MSTQVHIPAPLRAYTGQKKAVELEGAATVADLEPHLFVNDEDIRHLQGERTTLGERDAVSLVPAVSGGCA